MKQIRLETQNHTTTISQVDYQTIKKTIDNNRNFIITEAKITAIYPDLFHTIADNVADNIIVLPSGFNNKNFTHFRHVINKLVLYGFNRDNCLIGIGGGNVTDLVGFVASVFMRGVELVLIPTTIVAMTDAAIGGKNAINFKNRKNAIGTIYLPKEVLIYNNFYRTLKPKQMNESLVEIIKIGLIKNKNLLDNALNLLHKAGKTKQIDNYIGENTLAIDDIIWQSIKTKTDIVEKDLYSESTRKLLNFGHSIGHLIELKQSISHSKAVMIGMIYETFITYKLGYTDITIHNEIKNIAKQYYSINTNKYPIQTEIRNLYTDKKVHNDAIDLVLIKQIGNAELIKIRVKDIIDMVTTADF